MISEILRATSIGEFGLCLGSGTIDCFPTLRAYRICLDFLARNIYTDTESQERLTVPCTSMFHGFGGLGWQTFSASATTSTNPSRSSLSMGGKLCSGIYLALWMICQPL